MMHCSLYLPLEECMSTFNLENAVCNHGFFMMAPNLWIPSHKTLQRPIRLADSTNSCTVSISHPLHHTSLEVLVHGVNNLSSLDQHAVLAQVSRMLRISEGDERDVSEFHKVHAEAKKRCFGRIFRSPTLFEDAVKSILLCNCSWARTLNMARDLCKLQLELNKGDEVIRDPTRRGGVKRKRATYISYKGSNAAPSEGRDEELGNFPNAKELASLDEYYLNRHCNLGYRASRIIELARKVENGKLDLKKFEVSVSAASSYDSVYKKLMRIKGFGPYAAANVLMCLGYYQKIPVDSETIRHLQQVHARESCKKGNILKEVKAIYGKYQPFQCLAYWLELLEYYENKFGKLSELPKSCYHTITGSPVQDRMTNSLKPSEKKLLE